jgi:hypothetical protein
MASDIDSFLGVEDYAATPQGDFTDAGATSYTYAMGLCENAGAAPPFTVFANRFCLRATNAFLARALDAEGAVLGYSFAKAIPLATDGGTTDVTLGPWMAPSTTTVVASNLPANANVSAQLSEIAESGGVANPTSTGVNDGGSSFLTAPGFADAIQAAVRVTPPAQPYATLTVAKRQAPGASVALDYATALPMLTGATTDASDPVRPSVTWTSAASLATTDGGAVLLGFSRPQSEVGYSWAFVLPPGTTTAKAPQMPAEAADWLPQAPNDAGSTFFSDPEILFVESDTIPSYATFRQAAGLLVPATTVNGNDRGSNITLLTNGNLRLTRFQTFPL